MTAGAYLCLHLRFRQWAFISWTTLGISGGSISLNLLSLAFLLKKTNSLSWLKPLYWDPFMMGAVYCGKWFSDETQGFLYRQASSTFEMPSPKKKKKKKAITTEGQLCCSHGLNKALELVVGRGTLESYPGWLKSQLPCLSTLWPWSSD